MSATGDFIKELEYKPELEALLKYGTEVFGTVDRFTDWLKKENFYFDYKAPAELMKTAPGVKFIEDRLTAMEYGDNA